MCIAIKPVAVPWSPHWHPETFEKPLHIVNAYEADVGPAFLSRPRRERPIIYVGAPDAGDDIWPGRQTGGLGLPKSGMRPAGTNRRRDWL